MYCNVCFTSTQNLFFFSRGVVFSVPCCPVCVFLCYGCCSCLYIYVSKYVCVLVGVCLVGWVGAHICVHLYVDNMSSDWIKIFPHPCVLPISCKISMCGWLCRYQECLWCSLTEGPSDMGGKTEQEAEGTGKQDRDDKNCPHLHHKISCSSNRGRERCCHLRPF